MDTPNYISYTHSDIIKKRNLKVFSLHKWLNFFYFLYHNAENQKKAIEVFFLSA